MQFIYTKSFNPYIQIYTIHMRHAHPIYKQKTEKKKENWYGSMVLEEVGEWGVGRCGG
jgi:hypothetical protein